MNFFRRSHDKSEDRLRHVEAMMQGLIGLGVVSLIILLLFGLGTVNSDHFGTFFLWSSGAALASLLTGAALGMLFGLPTVRRVEISAPVPDVLPAENSAQPLRPSPSAPEVPLGYSDSTNLEHVADWLTKIIIGLTLTQYASWEGRFARLSFDLTVRMLGITGKCSARCAQGDFAPGMTIPGGSLMILFSVLGFIISYLWMRGYFITEMETAKRNAKDAAARKRRDLWAEDQRERQKLAIELDRLKGESETNRQKLTDAEQREASAREDSRKAREDLALETARRQKAEADAEAEKEKARSQGTFMDRTVTFTPEIVTSLAKKVEVLAPTEARSAAQQIKERVAASAYPDDPWRDQFGSKPERNGIALSATVKPSEADPTYFNLELMLAVSDRSKADVWAGKSAQVYLHPTFGSDPRTLSFNSDGQASLSLLAYGAFTVGVLVEDGTMLELNLATIPDAPAEFLSR